MSLKVYNTLTKGKEPFETVEDNKVKIYVCGPTVYDSCHIGHARSLVVFDVIVRYLRESGYEVTYVRNFTDIDDKIINRANELKISCEELSQKYIDEFHEDTGALNILNADIEPKATENIDKIIEIVQILIDKNHAYLAENGDVYFSVDSFSKYGKLSRRDNQENLAGARVDVEKNKKNPNDFVLWKKKKEGEPFWKSPWGEGRPGWHIECSAMSARFLGKSIDIHGGGQDLVFPHHENEIAQSEAAFDQQFAKYWIHNGFVKIDNEKMSKSLNNFFTIKDMLKKYHPEALRLFLLSLHYRSPVDFNDQSILEASLNLEKLYFVLQRAKQNKVQEKEQDSKSWEDFKKAMDDDFNTAIAISILLESAKDANRLMDQKKDAGCEIFNIKKMGKILGLLTYNPDKFFEDKKENSLKEKNIDKDKIESLIAQRKEARQNKDFKMADEIRDKLANMNIEIKDSKDGTSWNFIN